MSPVVIVAIPSKDDRVWRISSEKVPHMTLLNLGDNVPDSDIPRITNFLDHVANTSMHIFGMDVDRRGELGPDKADVLFFGEHGLKMLVDIRSFFLANPQIDKAFHSTTQFPEFVPHLTLGFPGSPAKEDTSDFPGIGWVQFDKIALWTGDSEGPEYPLLRRNDMSVMAMNDQVAEILEHHGVKGMKWGVHRARAAAGNRRSQRILARHDRKFLRKADDPRTTLKIYNAAAEATNKHDIDRINNKPQYRDADFTRDTPLRRKYYKEHHDAFVNQLEKAANDLGTNASGTKKYGVIDNADGSWDIVIRDVAQHADATIGHVNVIYDAKGHIIRIEVPKLSTMMQSEELVENFLEHFGVKGMKWGVRTLPSGGTVGTPTADAREASRSQKKISIGGTHALTTKELQSLVNRMNLEQQYSRLIASQPTALDRGHNQVKQILALANTGVQIFNLANSTAAKAGFALIKSAVVKG